MINNAAIVHRLAKQLDSPVPVQSTRRRRPPSPTLLARLPSTAFIQREAEQLAPLQIIRQLRRTPTPPPEPEEEESPKPRRERSSGSGATLSKARSLNKGVTPVHARAGWKDPEPFEIFRAIEKKDLVYLMEVRDSAFHLLLRKSGSATPLVHAMRLGKSYDEVSIILLGAFSRYINHLDDEEFALPKTKTMLKALRANLKLAIDHGLQSAQGSDLIASFLQTLIMSEGNSWIAAQITDIGLALRAGKDAKPVATAEAAVRSFATKELGKAQGAIATLEDYVANATADLLMLAAWSSALDQVTGGEPIPTYYFARDDRVYKAFVERLDRHASVINRALTKRLKWQLRVLRAVMEGRSTTLRSKVQVLADEFDEGPGV